MTRGKFGSFALVALAVAGCDSQPLTIGSGAVVTKAPPAEADGGSAQTGGGSTQPSGCVQPPDAATLPAECSDLVPCGPDVRSVFKAGPPPDLGRGGKIVDGTYDLTATTIYQSYQSAPTDSVSTDREAIRISGGGTRLEYVTASGGFTMLESIAPAGASLNPTTLCPGPGVSAGHSGPYYTATSDTFTFVNGLSVVVFALRR